MSKKHTISTLSYNHSTLCPTLLTHKRIDIHTLCFNSCSCALCLPASQEYIKCPSVQWSARQGHHAKILRRTKLNQDNNRSERRWLPNLHIYWSHASNHDRCCVFKYGIMMKLRKRGQRKSMRCYYSLSLIVSCLQLHIWGISRDYQRVNPPHISHLLQHPFECIKLQKARKMGWYMVRYWWYIFC